MRIWRWVPSLVTPALPNHYRQTGANHTPPKMFSGHSDYKAMKPYIDIAENTKANAMNLFEMELKK
jgi:hypothetical protein